MYPDPFVLYLGKSETPVPSVRPTLRVHDVHVWPHPTVRIEVSSEAGAESLIYALGAAITPSPTHAVMDWDLRHTYLHEAMRSLAAAIDCFEVEDDNVYCSAPQGLDRSLLEVERLVRAARVLLREDSAHRQRFHPGTEVDDGPES